MLLGMALPAHDFQIFQPLRSIFRCTGSPLNPFITAKSQKHETSSTEINKKHLWNLEKVLKKENSNIPADKVSRSKGFVEGLNLFPVWPEMKAAEDMSPRLLNRLKRLLSKSQEYSPRNNLGRRWREYHGCDDWKGLIDPLDENLRREVVRFGEFIQAAYHCFHSNPAISPDETQRPRQVSLPDKSYKLTKNLYATSSIGLPNWVDKVAPELGWMTQRTSWIGYVAVCEDRREIQRMGRRDIIIALRGTATCLEWAENMRDILVPISSDDITDAGETQNPRVECGFSSLFKTKGCHFQSLSESVVEEVQRLTEKYKGEDLSITITGHSLGAALALLVGDELQTTVANIPPIAVFSFGGPRVGNRSFANRLNSKNIKVLRIVNTQDLITKLPGMFVSEELDRKLRQSGAEKFMNAVDNNMPWAYTHVGTELKLDTKMSPYLEPHADIACCHDLEAYLHLVDGFMASNCPFRPNAKRSLWKLLNEQRSNVKRLYTSKANALRLSLEKRKSNLSTSSSLPTCLPSPS